MGAWSAAWRWQLSHARNLALRRRVIQRRRRLDDGQLLVGGPIPLAQGMLQAKREQRTVGVLSMVLDGYWRIARRLAGWRPPDRPGGRTAATLVRRRETGCQRWP
jgi:hypothetical protein